MKFSQITTIVSIIILSSLVCKAYEVTSESPERFAAQKKCTMRLRFVDFHSDCRSINDATASDREIVSNSMVRTHIKWLMSCVSEYCGSQTKFIQLSNLTNDCGAVGTIGAAISSWANPGHGSNSYREKQYIVTAFCQAPGQPSSAGTLAAP